MVKLCVVWGEADRDWQPFFGKGGDGKQGGEENGQTIKIERFWQHYLFNDGTSLPDPMGQHCSAFNCTSAKEKCPEKSFHRWVECKQLTAFLTASGRILSELKFYEAIVYAHVLCPNRASVDQLTLFSTSLTALCFMIIFTKQISSQEHSLQTVVCMHWGELASLRAAIRSFVLTTSSLMTFR